MRIGIPRGFYYHAYPGLWETLFAALDATVLVSEPTTRYTLDLAVTDTESEHCLPHKIFDGHVNSLIGKVDTIFVPRLLSMVRGHICCPRFGALPDATRARLRNAASILSIDINETRQPLHATLCALAKRLGASKRAARLAVTNAIDEMNRREADTARREQSPAANRKFLLLGHPYTLHDDFIAVPILTTLRRLRVPVERMTFAKKNLTPGDILWCTFHQMHQRLCRIDLNEYAGVIQITTFNCGADSMMTERFRRQCRRHRIPYMLLMVDEHTGQAGITTRLEAFVDSLRWRRTPS